MKPASTRPKVGRNKHFCTAPQSLHREVDITTSRMRCQSNSPSPGVKRAPAPAVVKSVEAGYYPTIWPATRNTRIVYSMPCSMKCNGRQREP